MLSKIYILLYSYLWYIFISIIQNIYILYSTPLQFSEVAVIHCSHMQCDTCMPIQYVFSTLVFLIPGPHIGIMEITSVIKRVTGNWLMPNVVLKKTKQCWSLVELPVNAEAAAARVGLPRAHTALAHLPPAPLLSGASHTQGTLVTGHAVWYRAPTKKDTDAGGEQSDQTDGKPCTLDRRWTEDLKCLTMRPWEINGTLSWFESPLSVASSITIILDCIILTGVSNVLSSTIGHRMGTRYRKHLSE